MDAHVGRILDANANRAREALRVMEEYARFALDDAELVQQAKNARHALADALVLGRVADAVVFRDTPGDVGTSLTTPQEYERGDAQAVVCAAGKRLSEALRVIEEYGKITSAEMAVRVEQLRYRGYELEKRLRWAVGARERWADVRVYVLVTESLCVGPWEVVVRAAAAGGADCFQLREKGLDDRALFARAEVFCWLCRELGKIAIINDRPDVAAAVGADGVHLGQDDLCASAARRVLGAGRIIGVSTHSPEQVSAAVGACPDYIAVGPMFSTPLKPEYGVAGPALLRAARGLTSLPLVAIGGITAENAGAVAEAGGRCVAVCSAVIGAADPAAAVGAIRKAHAEARS